MTKQTSSSLSLGEIILFQAIKFLLILIIGCCLSLIISLGTIIIGGSHGIACLQTIEKQQIDIILQAKQNGIFFKYFTQHTQAYISIILHILFIKTQLINLPDKIKAIYCSNLFIKKLLIVLYAKLEIYLPAMIMVVTVLILKLVTAILFLPLFVLLGFLGLAEGLMQRELRRLGGGRESALIYHRARANILPCLALSFFIYLVLPIPITPDSLFLPFAVSFGFLITYTFKYFKKYL